jgi:hypothetical protein
VAAIQYLTSIHLLGEGEEVHTRLTELQAVRAVALELLVLLTQVALGTLHQLLHHKATTEEIVTGTVAEVAVAVQAQWAQTTLFFLAAMAAMEQHPRLLEHL